MSKKLLIVLIVIMVGVAVFAPWQAKAQEFASPGGFLNKVANKAGLEKPASEEVMIGLIINSVLGFLGVIFLILIIYAGIRWMMSAGNDEEVKNARQIIKWAIIGVIVVIGAYALTSFVIDNVLKSAAPVGPERPEIPVEGEEDEMLDNICGDVYCRSYDHNEDGCMEASECCKWDGMYSMCLDRY